MNDDALDSYLDRPLYWAALVVLDHVDGDNAPQVDKDHFREILRGGAYEFIKASFEFEELECPSIEEIAAEALSVFQN